MRPFFNPTIEAVTYAKISPKMVNPRDIAGERRRRRKRRTLVATLPAPGVGMGSEMGLVVLVSVYCDWVRQQVRSATSISVWQHAQWESRSVRETH